MKWRCNMGSGIKTRVAYRIGNSAGELTRHLEPLRSLGPQEVLVAIHAVSLNYRDLLYIDSEPVSTGLVPGSDGAGSILEVGDNVRGFSVGDRVMPSFFSEWTDGRYDVRYRQSALGGGIDGTFASHIVVPADSLARIPDGMSFREASCLPCAAVTAWNALIGRSNIQAGDIVLVQGTGGVSLFAIQIALAVGAEPILISGSEEKISRVRELGVNSVVNYRHNANWQEAVLDLTGGQGCDHVLELIGNDNLARSIRCLRPGGTISYIGCLGGFTGGFDPLDLMYKNANLQAIYVGSRTDLEQLASDMRRWMITPVIDPNSFFFDTLPQAVEFLRQGAHIGKVVVEI
jgi:NADPH:quinone reductase-like Zn-dependent oxidoreductase